MAHANIIQFPGPRVQAEPQPIVTGPFTHDDLTLLTAHAADVERKDELGTAVPAKYGDSGIKIDADPLSWSRMILLAIYEQGGLHGKPRVVIRGEVATLRCHPWDVQALRDRFEPTRYDARGDIMRKVLAGEFFPYDACDLLTAFGEIVGRRLLPTAAMSAVLYKLHRDPIGWQEVADEYEEWRQADPQSNQPLTGQQFVNLARSIMEDRR